MAVASGRAGRVLARPLLLRKRARARFEYTHIYRAYANDVITARNQT